MSLFVLPVETHFFWETAIAVTDLPKTACVDAKSSQDRLTPRVQCDAIFYSSCLVCRVNLTLRRLGSDGHYLWTATVGWIGVCPDHYRRQLHFCGLCLRDGASPTVLCHENEDKATWPTVIATCGPCRSGHISVHLPHAPAHPDWDVRDAVFKFLNLSHGSVAGILQIISDKDWLRKYTKFTNIHQQAVAAARCSGVREDNFNSSIPIQDLEIQVRDLAISDWARSRIVKGCWMNPADGMGQQSQYDPPSQILADELRRAHDFHLRHLLIAPMRDVVQNLVKLSELDGVDPAIRCVRLRLDDVLERLRTTVKPGANLRVPTALSPLAQKSRESLKVVSHLRFRCGPPSNIFATGVGGSICVIIPLLLYDLHANEHSGSEY
ncbi:hypothetical protein B0H13DRAFT_1887482 [Mycena leptocephala]|nr:hypothetical protein B0H13DRAFT_1887482 [Mycena leptocephala]